MIQQAIKRTEPQARFPAALGAADTYWSLAHRATTDPNRRLSWPPDLGRELATCFINALQGGRHRQQPSGLTRLIDVVGRR
jgi:hypothetical protein